MKKIVVITLIAVASVAANAATVVKGVTAQTLTNVPTLLTGGATITSMTITTPATGAAIITLLDATTNSNYTPFQYTNGAYTATSSYITNGALYYYTNYYGVTTTISNTFLVDTSTTYSGWTNTFKTLASYSVPTNTTVVFDGLNLRAQFGIVATNSAAAGNGNTILTINYGQ